MYTYRVKIYKHERTIVDAYVSGSEMVREIVKVAINHWLQGLRPDYRTMPLPTTFLLRNMEYLEQASGTAGAIDWNVTRVQAMEQVEQLS